MTYAELDEMLGEYGGTAGLGADNSASEASFDPSSLTESMSAFINKQSNILSGAKLPDRCVILELFS